MKSAKLKTDKKGGHSAQGLFWKVGSIITQKLTDSEEPQGSTGNAGPAALWLKAPVMAPREAQT